jgi:cyclophilin family peptidyl-prolyl cis-trans isomerase
MSLFRHSRGSRSRFRPSVESLEDRSVPAGNVTATLTGGGTLLITGDGAANSVRIQGNSSATLNISSTDTTINNQTGSVTLGVFRGSIIIAMGDGNDSVVIDRVLTRGMLSIDMGAGDDSLAITTSAVRKDAIIGMGDGNDSVTLRPVLMSGNALVDVGAGDNRVNVAGSDFKAGAYLAAGAGTNSLGVSHSTFKVPPATSGFTQTINALLPAAANDSATVATGASVIINLTGNDSAGEGAINPATIVITDQPDHGSLTFNNDGTVSYKNDGTANATDSFRYTVMNSKGGISNIATATISITGIVGPTVAVTSTAGTVTKTSPIPFTATFSDSVTGFTQAEITVANGTVTTFTPIDAKTYNFTVTPTGQGAVVVTVPANVAQNGIGLNNSASTATTVTFDSTNPSITINNLTTSSTTPTLTGTVSESNAVVTVTVNNQNFTAAVSGTTWSVQITPALPAGTYAVTATATDLAGNASTANNGSGLIIDLTPPTFAISSNSSSPTGLTSIPITITFSENVTGFASTDITVGNGSLSGFTSIDQKTFTANLTPTANGAVTASIAAGAVTDQVGNQNAAGTPFTITFDSAALGVTVSSLTTNDTTPTLSGTVNNANATVSVTVNGQTLTAAVSGNTWTATVTTPLADGAYAVAATATFNGNSTTFNSPNGLIVDTVAPTVSVTSSLTSPTASTSIPITVIFSENVTGFTAADISVGNGTLGTLTQVDAKTYTASITPTTTGNVTVNIAAGGASDTAGNANAAAPTFTIAFSGAAPTVARTLANVTNPAATANTTILLPGTFADTDITNSSVTFKTTKGGTPLDLNVELFDKDAPLTVANFFNYFDRYAANGGTIFHRLVLENTLKVLQGGGFSLNDATDTISGHIATDPPIRNEFSSARLDVRGTIAMAKVGNQPDSATSEFFFNLDDANANTLNGNNNGGFVVFGKLVGAADLANVDSLAAVPIQSAQGFTELPLVSGTTPNETNIERITQIVVNHRDDELTYTASSSNTAAVTVSNTGFQGNQLVLDYQAAGVSTITVTATDKEGHSISTTFTVTVT